jgi:hypothetical protein
MTRWICTLMIGFLLPCAHAQKTPQRTCRILFLDGPDSAPDTLHLFDGTRSQEVDLPRMNLSKLYTLPSGPLTLRFVPKAVTDPTTIPAKAPAVTVAETMQDMYLLLTSDPGNETAPVKVQVINAGTEQLKLGQMLWFNLTANHIGGTVGRQKMVLGPQSRSVVEAPAAQSEGYPVNLGYRRPGNEALYPLCETKWHHDPRSRSLVFVIAEQGVRTPRVLAFPDYREAPKEEASP